MHRLQPTTKERKLSATDWFCNTKIARAYLKKIVKDPENLDKVQYKTTSVERIRTAYRDIKEFLRVNCDTSPKRLRQFYAAFTKRVKLIRIKTPSLTNALKVFETINDRGVGLNAMDLLKNLLFMKTTSGDYSKLKERWKKLIDTLNNCKEKPLRFLRYYVMSQFELDTKKPLREDDIYDWFVKNSKVCGLEENPLSFLNELYRMRGSLGKFRQSKECGQLRQSISQEPGFFERRGPTALCSAFSRKTSVIGIVFEALSIFGKPVLLLYHHPRTD